jgi:hypothetical protein
MCYLYIKYIFKIKPTKAVHVGGIFANVIALLQLDFHLLLRVMTVGMAIIIHISEGLIDKIV